jgi:GT2 family glycosyltransferase
MTLVDVVIPFYGQIDLLRKAVASVPAAMGEIPHKVVLVDDGTPDQLGRGYFSELDNSYKKIWLKQNMGYPASVNAGVHAVSSPLIFVLTSDVVMDPGSIVEAVKEMDDPEIGVVGSKLLFPEDSPHGEPGRIQHAGMVFSLTSDPKHIFLNWSGDHPRPNQRREMNIVTGAAFMTRRNLFMKVGGMNTIYGKGTYEDMEYCLMMKTLNKKVVYSPKVSGTHHVGASVTGENGKGFNLQGNQNLFLSRMVSLIEWDEWRHW